SGMATSIPRSAAGQTRGSRDRDPHAPGPLRNGRLVHGTLRCAALDDSARILDLPAHGRGYRSTGRRYKFFSRSRLEYGIHRTLSIEVWLLRQADLSFAAGL